MMWPKTNLFSRVVMPLRLAGSALILYAFLKILVVPELLSIGIALSGALIWQAATAVERNSPIHKRLASAALKEIMRTRAVRVESARSIAQFRSEHPELSTDAFIVATQDGYDTGITTPEELDNVPAETLRNVTVGQVAHPLVYVSGLRSDDQVLEAFVRLDQSKHSLLPVLDGRENLVGVVTTRDVDQWLHHHAQDAPLIHGIADERLQSA